MNIKTAIRDFLVENDAVRPALTARSYRTGIDRFRDFLRASNISESVEVVSVGVEPFIGFPAWLMARYSNKSCMVYMSAVKALLDSLVVSGGVEMSYKDTVRYRLACQKLKRRRDQKLPRMAPKGAADKIVAAATASPLPSPIKERDLAIVEFMRSSGCRIAEVSALKIKDVSFKDLRAKVLGKGNKERIVYFSQDAARYILAYLQLRPDHELSDPLFCRHDDGAGQNTLKLGTGGMREVVKQLAILAGYDNFHPHLFRHNFGTVMINETGDLALVQDLLGHASPASTRVYAKTDPAHLKQSHHDVWDKGSSS